MAHRYIVRHGHHHRHRNPLGINAGTITFAAWGVAGGVGARAIPAMVMSAQNTGWMGYLLNFGAAIGLGFAGRFIGGQASEAMLVGGLVSTGLRIVQDNFGSKIPGLGAYWNSYLPSLPAQSNPYGQMPNPAAEAAAAAAAAAPRAGMGGSRFTGGRFRRF